MGTKFSITGDAVNLHASNLDTSVNALNSQARAFLSAIEPLPAVRKGTAYGSWVGPPMSSPVRRRFTDVGPHREDRDDG